LPQIHICGMALCGLLPPARKKPRQGMCLAVAGGIVERMCEEVKSGHEFRKVANENERQAIVSMGGLIYTEITQYSHTEPS
jgi:hypothetical protein